MDSLRGDRGYATRRRFFAKEAGMRTRTMARRPSDSPTDRVRSALHKRLYAEAVRLALDVPEAPELLFEAVSARVGFWRESGQTEFALDLLRKVWPRLRHQSVWAKTL